LVVLLTLAAVINYLDRATISVALPKIAHDFALGPTAKGLVLSSFFWCYTVIQIPVGVLVDRCNMRWLYAGAFAMWSVACGLTGFVGGMATLLAMRIILGIGESVLLPGNLKIVNILFAPRDRGLPTGMCTSGTRLGLALGAPLVAWLTVRYGWRLMFAIVGFSAFVWLLPWVLVYPARSSSRIRTSDRQRAGDERRGWGFTVDRNLVGCCLGYFSFGYYQYTLMTWLPDYFVHVRHFQLLQAGVYASLSYLIWGLGAAAGGWFGDSLIRRGWNETRVRKWVVTSSFATGLLLIPAILAPSATSAMLLLAGASLVGLSSANALVILQDCAPLGEVGAWAGAANFIGNLGGVLSPLVTGILISRTGAYFPGFALAPLVLIAGVLPYWLLVGDLKPRRDRL
jgi:ACS family D-galactonate transporter-like MFS transporter